MSDPVSNVEIEDVLSSIRRLVSEENRPTARRDPQDAPRKPSRLVLTPSLLVPVPDPDDSTDDPAEDSTQNIAADTAADQAEDHAEDDKDKAPGDSPVSFSTEQAGDPEPDQASDQPDDFTQTAEADSDTLDLTNFQAESGAYLDLDADTNAGPGTDTAPWANPDSTLFQAAESADDPEVMDLGESPDGADSEDVKAVDDTQDDLDTSDSTEAAKTEPDTTPDSADTTETDANALVQDTPTSDEAPSEGSTPEPADRYNTATLSAKIAVLEAKIGQTQDQWEPDGETDDDYAGTPVETIEWQDHTEDTPEPVATAEPEFIAAPVAEATSEPAPEQVADAPAGETLDFLPEDEAILDEDSLRELVSDIVRQELQGALGERITRNVRKLVRREIHRALTAQELD